MSKWNLSLHVAALVVLAIPAEQCKHEIRCESGKIPS